MAKHRRPKWTLTVWWALNCATFLAAADGWLDSDGKWQPVNPRDVKWVGWSAARTERVR